MSEILISGAGIAGPTLAYWLLANGSTPTLVERAPRLRTGGYIIDFWGLGYDVADRMDLLPVLERDGYRLREVRLVDRSGRRVAGFDTSVFDAATGGRFVSLGRSDLARRIYELIDGRVETIFDDSITAIADDGAGVMVAFERTPARRFDAVVGADGLHSNVRSLVFGDGGRFEKFLGYYVAAFSAPGYPHRDEGAYVSSSDVGRQVARYALRDGRSAFFLMFARQEPLALAHHDVAAQKQVVHDTFRGAGWETPEILARLDDANDFYFDAVSQTRMTDWYRGRTVLVGDAAYGPSLLAGEGTALGMAGAYVLAHAMRGASDGRGAGAIEAAFARYQREFKPFMDERQRSAERFAPWFAPRTKLELWLRTVVTNLMGWPVLGKAIVSRSFVDRYALPLS